ncbi:hypothetical protein PSKAS_10140 [Peribacillus sp. N1]
MLYYSQLNIFLLHTFEVRIEEQKPLVHILRRMRSYDYCGKGNLPKPKESHVLEAGSAIE